MFQITGILKQDEIKDITKKDGSIVKKRIAYIEPVGSIFPMAISIDGHNKNIGKIGDQITLDVNIYPYYFADGKIKRANVNYYVLGE